MRYMILVQATADTEAGKLPDVAMMETMLEYHEELAKAGALLDGNGLRPTAEGWRIVYDGEKRTVVDGPFAEAKELVAGYTMIEVGSREEAIEWSRRFPNPVGPGARCHVEVRRLFEEADFGENEGADRLREFNELKKPAG